MDDALLDEHVGNDDLGAVDEDVVAVDGDGEGAVGQGGQIRAVGEQGGVADDVGDDVVAENAGQLLDGGVDEGGADGLEGGVVGDEGGQVGGQGAAGDAGHGEGADRRGLVQGDEGGGDVLGNGEEGVDDVDDAAGEVDVLGAISTTSSERARDGRRTACVTVEFCSRPE